MKTQQLKTYGMQHSSNREVYNNKNLPQKARKTSNRQPKFIPKTTGEKRTATKKLIEGKKS